jgi:hypothetical protein
MAIMTLVAQQARKTKAKPYNKKQAINAFVLKFKHSFDMKDDGIDLREMAVTITTCQFLWKTSIRQL